MLQPAPSPFHDSTLIEKFLYEDFVLSSNDCGSTVLTKAYAKEIPYLQLTSSKKKSKIEKFRKAGLIGCLNDSGITSENYKDELYKND